MKLICYVICLFTYSRQGAYAASVVTTTCSLFVGGRAPYFCFQRQTLLQPLFAIDFLVVHGEGLYATSSAGETSSPLLKNFLGSVEPSKP